MNLSPPKVSHWTLPGCRRGPTTRTFRAPHLGGYNSTPQPTDTLQGHVSLERAKRAQAAPLCYRECRTLKGPSALPVPPVSPGAYLRGQGATCSCFKYFRISLKSAVLSVTSVAPDSLQDAARRKSLTKDFGKLLSSRLSFRAITAIEDPAWSQAEWLGVITRPALVKGPSKSSRICRTFEGVLAPTISS